MFFHPALIPVSAAQFPTSQFFNVKTISLHLASSWCRNRRENFLHEFFMYPLKWKQRGRDPLEALLILSAKAALFHSAYDLSTYACQIIYTIPRTSFYPYLCQTSLLNNFSVNCTINFKQNLVIPLCITLKFRSTLSKQPNYTALTKNWPWLMTGKNYTTHFLLLRNSGKKSGISFKTGMQKKFCWSFCSTNPVVHHNIYVGCVTVYGLEKGRYLIPSVLYCFVLFSLVSRTFFHEDTYLCLVFIIFPSQVQYHHADLHCSYYLTILIWEYAKVCIPMHNIHVGC